MSDAAAQEQIAAAEAYEELHVPALFGQWAGPVLDAARVETGQRVLDVACGTGVLARAAAARVGPSGVVAGVDPGSGMLAVARRLAPAIEWRQGTAEELPYPDGGFDAVVSQFGSRGIADGRIVHRLRRDRQARVPAVRWAGHLLQPAAGHRGALPALQRVGLCRVSELWRAWLAIAGRRRRGPARASGGG